MKIVSKSSDSGKITYNSDIIPQIVRDSLKEIENVELSTLAKGSVNARRYNGIRVEAVGDLVHVDVYLKVGFSKSVKDAAYNVQQKIKNTLETMTEFKVGNINIHVVDVDFA